LGRGVPAEAAHAHRAHTESARGVAHKGRQLGAVAEHATSRATGFDVSASMGTMRRERRGPPMSMERLTDDELRRVRALRAAEGVAAAARLLTLCPRCDATARDLSIADLAGRPGNGNRVATGDGVALRQAADKRRF